MEEIRNTPDSVDAFMLRTVPVEYNTELEKQCRNGDLSYVAPIYFESSVVFRREVHFLSSCSSGNANTVRLYSRV